MREMWALNGADTCMFVECCAIFQLSSNQMGSYWIRQERNQRSLDMDVRFTCVGLLQTALNIPKRSQKWAFLMIAIPLVAFISTSRRLRDGAGQGRKVQCRLCRVIGRFRWIELMHVMDGLSHTPESRF